MITDYVDKNINLNYEAKKQFLIPAVLFRGPVKNLQVKNLFPNLLETNQNLLSLLNLT